MNIFLHQLDLKITAYTARRRACASRRLSLVKEMVWMLPSQTSKLTMIWSLQSHHYVKKCKRIICYAYRILVMNVYAQNWKRKIQGLSERWSGSAQTGPGMIRITLTPTVLDQLRSTYSWVGLIRLSRSGHDTIRYGPRQFSMENHGKM